MLKPATARAAQTNLNMNFSVFLYQKSVVWQKSVYISEYSADPMKCRQISTKLPGVTHQKRATFIVTAVNTRTLCLYVISMNSLTQIVLELRVILQFKETGCEEQGAVEIRSEVVTVSQSGKVNAAPAEKLSRVGRVLHLTGNVNFTLPKSIV